MKILELTTTPYSVSPLRKVPKINEYKSSAYEDTNNKITQILEKFLKDTGIELEISASSTFIDDIWVSNIKLISESKEIFSTSGKGKGINASIASGFGEMMERLQAGFLYFKNCKNLRTFSLKEEVTTEEFLLNEKFDKIIRENSTHLPTRDFYYDRYIPMQEIVSKKKIMLSSRYFCSSTGFASGNTYEEAILQALCEVFERSCAFQILANKRECPTIPLETLNPRLLEKIQQLKEKGISSTAKDMSLSKGFPVAGILFYHESLKMYEFGVGSATSINHALERCITEYLQMERNINQRVKEINEYNKKYEHFYNTFQSLEKYLPFQVRMAFDHSYQGLFPSDGLIFLSQNTGAYQKWDYSHKNMASELNNILKLLEKHHYHVYLKDYNSVGFPTVSIVVPELYSGHFEHSFFISKEIRDFRAKLRANIFDIKPSELDILLKPEFLSYFLTNPTVSRFFNSMTEVPNFNSMWDFFIAFSQHLGRYDIVKLYTSYWNQISPREVTVQFNKSEEKKFRKEELVNSQCPSCSQCPVEYCKIKQIKKLYLKLIDKNIYPLRWIHL